MQKTVRAGLLTIGDEILYGHITDTNSRDIADLLSNIGIRVVKKISVGDNREEILENLADFENRVDLVICTGGLGPTKDDITKKTLADFFDSELAIHDTAFKDIAAFFEKRGKEFSPLNQSQAQLPLACQYIPNRYGTAPGMWFEKKNTIYISLPGVPHEMKSILRDEIVPRLKKQFQTPVITHQVIRTVGIGESYLADKIEAWENALPEAIKLAYLPEAGQVKLRLSISGTDEEQNKRMLAQQIPTLQQLAGDYIYSYENQSLEEVIGQLFLKHNLSLATAESCTGGAISAALTSIPGSSAYFKGSVVAYSNEIKIQQLAVEKSILNTFGAVSEPTVIQMAENARDLFQSDFALSVSGIAGPGGGSVEKPVGTIWIACAGKRATRTKKLQLGTERMVNIRSTVVAALNLLRESLS